MHFIHCKWKFQRSIHFIHHRSKVQRPIHFIHCKWKFQRPIHLRSRNRDAPDTQQECSQKLCAPLGLSIVHWLNIYNSQATKASLQESSLNTDTAIKIQTIPHQTIQMNYLQGISDIFLGFESFILNWGWTFDSITRYHFKL